MGRPTNIFKRSLRGILRHPFRIGMASGAVSIPLLLLESKIYGNQFNMSRAATKELENLALSAGTLGYIYGAPEKMTRLQKLRAIARAHPYRMGIGTSSILGLGGLGTYTYLKHRKRR